MDSNHSSEKGQAIVLLVLGIVMLLGFTALAVDGGMVYSNRRNAQNAADAAALAGALQKANGRDNGTVSTVARDSLITNGYSPSNARISISVATDFSGTYDLVTVVLTDTTRTNFAQVLTGGRNIKNVVTAIGRARRSQPALPGSAIVSLGDCTDGGNAGFNLDANGGGNDGGILSYDGGMFANSPEGVSESCAIEPGNSAQAGMIEAPDGYHIYSVGAHDYSGEDHIQPAPIDTGINGGVPIDDPIADLPEPICPSNGSISTSNGTTIYHAGRFGGSGQPSFGTAGVLNPGIYCITGDLNASGNEEWNANSGVVLYFINGSLRFTGSANFFVNAPNENTCNGTAGDPSASCTYKGIAIFAARSNSSEFNLSGNGLYTINGLVYALNGTFTSNGGGNSADEYVIFGQLIAKSIQGSGGGTFRVRYNAGNTYIKPPEVSLQR